MRLRALAKINLGLDVLGKRDDGYHELRMIMQTINMYDQLDIEISQEPGIHISTNLPFIPTNENNLVYKAAKLLMDEFHIQQGITVELQKFIPVAAGMAGGSSDAAAAMIGVNRLFGLGTDGERRKDWSGCSLLPSAGDCSGRGDRRKTSFSPGMSRLLCADRQAGYQCFHKICLRKPSCG